MRRLAVMFAAFAALLAAAIGVAAYLWGDEAIREGRSMYTTAQYFEMRARRHAQKLPLVVWIGDSTIMPGDDVQPYPREIARRLKDARRATETIILADAGIGPFVAYSAVGKALSLQPTAIYIVANMRALARTGKERGALDAASFIPTRELPRAVLLPWHAADITIPRLLLARSLGWPEVRRLFHFAEGLRLMFRDQIYSKTPPLPIRRRVAEYRRDLEQWHAPIDKGSSQLVMLRAAVELAVRNGVRTTVVMHPIPPHVFDYSPRSAKDLAARSGTVGRVVTAAGARYVNLHNALRKGEFRDFGGHYTAQGTGKMATRLEAFVRKDVVDLFYRPLGKR